MADINQVIELLMESSLNPTGKFKVKTTFPGQMAQIKSLFRNDTTGLIATISDFMINCGTVEKGFDASNSNLAKLFTDTFKNINKDLSMDIPVGLRGFSEQLLRERWTSSFQVVKIVWKVVDGYDVPSIMYVYDGASIKVVNTTGEIDKTKYYFGSVDEKNLLKNKENETILIRKPFNQWYDLYPTPYFVRRGTLYHGLFKNQLLNRQADIINTAFPYQFLIKVGTQEMIKRGMGPTEEDLKKIIAQYQDRNIENLNSLTTKKLVGAFPADVNFEELIPDYERALKDTILKGTDKNILNSLGMIELKGFSQTREEAILNPKVLIEEVVDAVMDEVVLIQQIVEMTRERNSHKYKMGDYVNVEPGIIESFVTDEMRTLIRSWYDRGIISKQDALEATTALHFKTQVIKRKNEKSEGIDEICFAPVIQNQGQDNNQLPQKKNDDVPDDKKGIEKKNFEVASEEVETVIITEPLKSIRSIPNEFRANMSNDEQQVFKAAFNQEMAKCKELKMDDELTYKQCVEVASGAVLEAMKKGGK